MNAYLPTVILRSCEEILDELELRSRDKEGQVIAYDRGSLYHAIYLALRGKTQDYIDRDYKLILELLKYSTGAINWSSNQEIVNAFENEEEETID